MAGISPRRPPEGFRPDKEIMMDRRPSRLTQTGKTRPFARWRRGQRPVTALLIALVLVSGVAEPIGRVPVARVGPAPAANDSASPGERVAASAAAILSPAVAE